MTERPIIFSGPMVRALLAGRKSMTRRLTTSPLAKCNPGDHLWVRESVTRSGGLLQYVADHKTAHHQWPVDWRQDVRPSIHMPRWASRITLDVTAARVERLHDITEADARAEGILYVPGHGDITIAELHADPGYSNYLCSRLGFQSLWEDLHGHGSWIANPGVVVITFRRTP